MKKVITILFLLLTFVTVIKAQKQALQEKKSDITIEDLKEVQKSYITKKAGLTEEEAALFFPLYFELQKKIKDINKDIYDKLGIKYGEECSEEKSLLLVHEYADAKIKIVQLETEYIYMYLKFLTAKKVRMIKNAEDKFKRNLIRNMCKKGNKNKRSYTEEKSDTTDYAKQ